MANRPAGGAAQNAAPAAPGGRRADAVRLRRLHLGQRGPRNKKVAFDSPFFTPEVRFDTHYMQSLNNPIDHTLGGATESFRSGEVQVEQASVGGDFHMDNVRGRILFMQGLFATTTPRNDASAAVGQWDVRGAYKYVSEAYGGYHFDVQHGLNVDAGIFVSYIGLFSYYNFDNWTYQPSYVSSNTPWFFNGLRIQWFPTNKLKIEPWFINGWQSYNKFNGRPGMGGQILWTPTENIKFVFNNYFNGTDTLGVPDRKRFQTDDSFLLRYYNRPENDGYLPDGDVLYGRLGLRVWRRRDVQRRCRRAGAEVRRLDGVQPHLVPQQSLCHHAGWRRHDQSRPVSDAAAAHQRGGCHHGLAVLPGDSRKPGAPVGCHLQLPVLSRGLHHVLGGGRLSPLRRALLQRPWRHHATGGQQRVPSVSRVQHRRDRRHQ